MEGYFVIIRGEEAQDDGLSVARPKGWDDNQEGPCPDCGGQWVWRENGYVPGTRECVDCGSLFNFKNRESGDWSLVREKFYRGW